MRTLTNQEKRTVRLGAIAISIYLALFCGLRVWKYLANRRVEYQRLVTEAKILKRDLQVYQDKALVVQTLMESLHLDPAKLSKASAVAETSAAIQRAAATGGIQLGPIRESAARPSAKELASMQLEGVGPVPAVVTFLHRLEVIGCPLIVDSVQISQDPSKPGMVKINLTIVILDFDQWKNEERPNV